MSPQPGTPPRSSSSLFPDPSSSWNQSPEIQILQVTTHHNRYVGSLAFNCLTLNSPLDSLSAVERDLTQLNQMLPVVSADSIRREISTLAAELKALQQKYAICHQGYVTQRDEVRRLRKENEQLRETHADLSHRHYQLAVELTEIVRTVNLLEGQVDNEAMNL